MRKKTSLLLIAGLLSLNPIQLFGQSVEESCPETKILKDTARAFTCVAKHCTPAVVFIESEVPHSKLDMDDGLDSIREDFFNRFFGVPGMPENGKSPKQKKKSEEIKGSGFIVSADGYILTNNHVVDGAEKINVVLSGGKEVPAKVIGRDPKSDLAVIKIEGKDHPYLPLGDSDALEIGEWVIAIGNPFGLDASVTVGVVSAKGRNQLHITDFEDFIQTDAAINPGNSGGPLLDVDGKVIGINTAIVSGSGGYMGIGFAVPSNMAKKIMGQLIESGEVTRGFLGVSLQPLDSDLVAAFHLKNDKGALAAEISKDSPAEKAGLKQGDVITSFNGLPVENLSAFRNSVSMMNPGTPLKLVVMRDGKEFTVNATVGTYPIEETKPKVIQSNVSSKIGFDVEALTPELAAKYGYSPNDKGVIVRKVSSGSLAELAGLKTGAMIVQVDKQEVKTIAEFEKAIKEAIANKKVLFLAKQGPATRYIALQLE